MSVEEPRKQAAGCGLGMNAERSAPETDHPMMSISRRLRQGQDLTTDP